MTAKPVTNPVLPDEWCETVLGEVAESMKNGLYKKAEAYADDGVPCLRMYNIDAGKIVWRDVKRMRLTDAELVDYELLPGDLLVNRVNSRELVGKTALIPSGMERSVFESKNIRLRLDKGRVVPAFINYQLLAFGNRYFDSNAQQVVGMASVSQKQLANFPIVLPPIERQRVIVVEIEKQFSHLDEAVDNLKRVKANLKRYKAAVLKAAVEGKLTATAKDDGLFDETQWRSIGSVLLSIDQGWSPKCEKNPVTTAGTWGVIKTTAVQEFRFDEVENKELPKALEPRPNLEIKVGDLLVTRAGPRNRVGVSCLVQSTKPGLMICDKVYRLRCDTSKIRPAYLELVLNAPQVLGKLNELKTGISDSGVNLTQKRFRGLSIPVPSLSTQASLEAEVERIVSTCEAIEGMCQAGLARSDRLRKAILTSLFQGDQNGKV